MFNILKKKIFAQNYIKRLKQFCNMQTFKSVKSDLSFHEFPKYSENVKMKRIFSLFIQ